MSDSIVAEYTVAHYPSAKNAEKITQDPTSVEICGIGFGLTGGR